MFASDELDRILARHRPSGVCPRSALQSSTAARSSGRAPSGSQTSSVGTGRRPSTPTASARSPRRSPRCAYFSSGIEVRSTWTLRCGRTSKAPEGPTVRQALAHLSGIQREPPGEIWETLEPPSRDELLERLAEAEPRLCGARRDRRAPGRGPLSRVPAGSRARPTRVDPDDVHALPAVRDRIPRRPVLGCRPTRSRIS